MQPSRMLLLCAAVSLAAVRADDTRHPVILVADVGVDDASGVLFALASPKLDVLGIAATYVATTRSSSICRTPRHVADFEVTSTAPLKLEPTT
mgnify:CR=1 FL=1